MPIDLEDLILDDPQPAEANSDDNSNGNGTPLAGLLQASIDDVNGQKAAAAVTHDDFDSDRTLPTGTRKPLFFDLETIPDESRLSQFGLEPLPTMKLRTPHGDCPPAAAVQEKSLDDLARSLETLNPDEKWLAELESLERQRSKGARKGAMDAIAECRGQADSILAAAEERRKLLSVTPEFCRIVAMGWSCGEADDVKAIVTGQQPRGGVIDERALLDFFWSLVERSGPVVGFGIAHFDLPVIFVRSALLGVKPSRRIDLTPWKGDCIDLYQRRFPKGSGGLPGGGGLKNLARIYGLPVPAGDVDGSKVFELFRDDPAKLREYVRSDVAVVKSLYAFFRGTFF